MPTIVIATLACMAGAFLICGIPSGLIIARHSSERGLDEDFESVRYVYLTDEDEKLSGVVTLGRLIVSQVAFGGDFSQTAALGASGWSTTALYMACVLGHVYSPYLGFHGGKGISVGLGAGLGFCWPVTLMMLAVFLVLAVPTRYVSLGSVSAAISLPIISFAWGIRGVAIVPLLVVAAVVVFAHRGNIKKLAYGQERTFSVHKRGGEKDGR